MAASLTCFRRGFSGLNGPAAALVLLGSAGLGCAPHGLPPRPSEPTPTRQFVLHGVRFEERRAGQTLWRGSCTQAEGDLQTSDAEDVTLDRIPQTPSERPMTLRAPRAHLAFDAGHATFEDVRVEQPGGATLRAKAAVYDEAEGILQMEGPLTLASPSFETHANHGTVWLKVGMVEIVGPVEGRMHKRAGGRKP